MYISRCLGLEFRDFDEGSCHSRQACETGTTPCGPGEMYVHQHHCVFDVVFITDEYVSLIVSSYVFVSDALLSDRCVWAYSHTANSLNVVSILPSSWTVYFISIKKVLLPKNAKRRTVRAISHPWLVLPWRQWGGGGYPVLVLAGWDGVGWSRVYPVLMWNGGRGGYPVLVLARGDGVGVSCSGPSLGGGCMVGWGRGYPVLVLAGVSPPSVNWQTKGKHYLPPFSLQWR